MPGVMGELTAEERACVERREKKKPCPNCRWYLDDEWVVCRKPVGSFYVIAAERIVYERPRRAVTVPRRALRRYVRDGDVNPCHVAHVDRSQPGILARVTHVVGMRRVLIEGHHRALQAWEAGEDFRAYELTEEETAEVCYRRGVPPGMRRRP